LSERHIAHTARVRFLGSLGGRGHGAGGRDGSGTTCYLSAVRVVVAEGWMGKKGVVRIVFWGDRQAQVVTKATGSFDATT